MDRVGVVNMLDQFVAFRFRFADAASLDVGVAIGVGFRGLEVTADVFTHGRDRFVVELDSLVVVLDPGFDIVDGHRSLVACSAAFLAADADEVRVDGAVTVLGVTDDEPAAARTAEDGAFEVVEVWLRSLTPARLCEARISRTCARSRVQGRRAGRGLPGVDDAAAADHADVIGVREEAVRLRRGRVVGRGLTVRGRGRPRCGEFVEQGAHRPITRRVGLEGEGTSGRGRGRFDGADLTAVDDGRTLR